MCQAQFSNKRKEIWRAEDDKLGKWIIFTHNRGSSWSNPKSTMASWVIWPISFNLFLSHTHTHSKDIINLRSIILFMKQLNLREMITSVIRRITSSFLRCFPSKRGARSSASIWQKSGPNIGNFVNNSEEISSDSSNFSEMVDLFIGFVLGLFVILTTLFGCSTLFFFLFIWVGWK